MALIGRGRLALARSQFDEARTAWRNAHDLCAALGLTRYQRALRRSCCRRAAPSAAPSRASTRGSARTGAPWRARDGSRHVSCAARAAQGRPLQSAARTLAITCAICSSLRNGDIGSDSTSAAQRSATGRLPARVAEVAKALLLVQRARVVDRRADAALG